MSALERLRTAPHLSENKGRGEGRVREGRRGEVGRVRRGEMGEGRRGGNEGVGVSSNKYFCCENG